MRFVTSRASFPCVSNNLPLAPSYKQSMSTPGEVVAKAATSESEAKEQTNDSVSSEEFLKKLTAAFSKLDVNKDGMVSRQEFIAGVLNDKEMQKLLSVEVESKGSEVSPSPKSPDPNAIGGAKGSLSDHKVYREKRGRKLGVVLEYFKRLDADDSGEITIEEFSEFFHSEKLSGMIASQLKAEVDITKNLSAADSAMVKQLFAFIDALLI